VAAALLLGGCAREAAWDWSGAAATPGDAAIAAAPPDRHARVGPGTDPAVMVFPRSAFRPDERVADARRDGVLGAGGSDADALPGRLAWPREARPDLRYTVTVRTTRSAERWVYPSSTSGRRDAGWRRGYGAVRHDHWGEHPGYVPPYPPPAIYPPSRRW
jgi:hypothetical protein